MTGKRPKSEFARALTHLCDATGLFTRGEWSSFLGVTESAISQWTNDKTIPRPEVLRQILLVLSESDDIPQEVIASFWRIANQPAFDVTPHAKNVGKTVAHYIVRPVRAGFRRSLEPLPAHVQETVLQVASLLCLIIHRCLQDRVTEHVTEINLEAVLRELVGCAGDYPGHFRVTHLRSLEEIQCAASSSAGDMRREGTLAITSPSQVFKFPSYSKQLRNRFALLDAQGQNFRVMEKFTASFERLARHIEDFVNIAVTKEASRNLPLAVQKCRSNLGKVEDSLIEVLRAFGNNESLLDTPAFESPDTFSECLPLDCAVPAPNVILRSQAAILANEAMTIAGGYRAAVRFLSQDRNELIIVGHAAIHDDSWPKDFIGRPFPISQDSAASHAITEKRSYVLRDLQQHQGEVGDNRTIHFYPVQPNEARSHAAILIRFESHVIGVLSIDCMLADAFDDVMVNRLESLAVCYASFFRALSSDHYFAKLDEHLLSSQVRNGAYPDYDGVLRAVAQMIGAPQGAIFLREPGSQRYGTIATLKPQNWIDDERWYLPGEGVTGWVIRHKRPVRIDDLRDKAKLTAICPADPPVWKQKSCGVKGADPRQGFSFLAAPILVGDECWGVIRLVDVECDRGFSYYDEQILVATAARLSCLLPVEANDRRANAQRWVEDDVKLVQTTRRLESSWLWRQ